MPRRSRRFWKRRTNNTTEVPAEFFGQVLGRHGKWRENFSDNLGAVKARGYPDTFIRMWGFYLCYCEGGFTERAIGDVDMLLVKPENRAPSVTPSMAGRRWGRSCAQKPRRFAPAGGFARKLPARQLLDAIDSNPNSLRNKSPRPAYSALLAAIK